MNFHSLKGLTVTDLYEQVDPLSRALTNAYLTTIRLLRRRGGRFVAKGDLWRPTHRGEAAMNGAQIV